MVPLLGLAAVPAGASVQLAQSVAAALHAAPDQKLRSFYGTADYRPVWVRNGSVVPEARRLVEILRAAELDGMTSGAAQAASVEESIARAASGHADDLARAELTMSSAWVDYVQTLRRPVDVGMLYVDRSVSPTTPLAPEILRAAAAAPSLANHMESARKLNPLYNGLRDALAALRQGSGVAPGQDRAGLERQLRLNMDRARALPADQSGRYVLVDAANARLFLYENGTVRDSMRVIVGKPSEQTPMIASMIKTAVLNPYWNVPPDLVQKRIAPNVLKEGAAYLRNKRYEVLADWSENPRALDPRSVDWAAVAAGRQEVRVRQLPGPGNSMGEMKFMFPNEFGVYLHDTPEKALFAKADRNQSSGCVRVEDAGRLASWLFGATPRTRSSAPEQVVELSKPVPVYITYLTAAWDGTKVALGQDPYSRDVNRATRFASSRRVAAD